MKKYLVKSIIQFTYEKYDTLQFVKKPKTVENIIYVGDEFYCNKEQCDYLMGNNDKNIKAVEIISIENIEEEVKEIKKEIKQVKKSTKSKK